MSIKCSQNRAYFSFKSSLAQGCIFDPPQDNGVAFLIKSSPSCGVAFFHPPWAGSWGVVSNGGEPAAYWPACRRLSQGRSRTSSSQSRKSLSSVSVPEP